MERMRERREMAMEEPRIQRLEMVLTSALRVLARLGWT